jgi:probable rRNA maturation factor
VSIVVHAAAERGRAPLSAARVTALVALVCQGEGVKAATMSVTFVSSRRMAAVNREQLGHAGATDIITFELSRPVPSAPVMGDIYICPDVARQNAATWQVPVREEYARLVIHGTLHTLGHEHPEGDARLTSPMWRLQEQYVRKARKRGIV